MSQGNPILKLDQVTRRYPTPDAGPGLLVLDWVTLELASGDSLAVVGPSGSGKSTLLQIMGTLDSPDSGKVVLNGRDISQLGEIELSAVRNREIGFVFQTHFLLPQCTLWENVLVPTLAKKRAHPPGSAESSTARAERLLRRIGLFERRSHLPGQLSGGERQRAAVVRALINSPQLLLADEPTGSLDHASALQLGEMLRELNREERVSLVLVTHSRELASLMGKSQQLRNGKLEDVCLSEA